MEKEERKEKEKREAAGQKPKLKRCEKGREITERQRAPATKAAERDRGRERNSVGKKKGR